MSIACFGYIGVTPSNGVGSTTATLPPSDRTLQGYYNYYRIYNYISYFREIMTIR